MRPARCRRGAFGRDWVASARSGTCCILRLWKWELTMTPIRLALALPLCLLALALAVLR